MQNAKKSSNTTSLFAQSNIIAKETNCVINIHYTIINSTK